ncbi:MAG TPA: hydrogenase maturation protease [Peptococcaceae bacterium]|nr:hydrogenase maturation protease [Peptococcaceae bacterium]
MNKITILGLGNPLLKDDGIGPYIIKVLQQNGLPEGINAVSVGGCFYDYWDILTGSEKIIVVDALQGGGPPGTVYLLKAGDLALEQETGFFRHEDDFFSALEFLKMYNISPQVTIVGVEPREISYSLELSPEIMERIPDLVELILSLCQDSKLHNRLESTN